MSTTTTLETFTEDLTKYQQKTDRVHILDNPDTYIGSVEMVDMDAWILNETEDKIICKNIHYIPGLYKLFDEAIVNCRDHMIRMKQQIDEKNGEKEKDKTLMPVTQIEITLDNDGTITMMNDGTGIPVAMHPEHNVYIPELIFGHLRSSVNYNKDEKKIVGGKNGFGVKLCYIWSTEGTVETVDHNRKLKYKQTFKNNLSEICPPIIESSGTKKPYTKISFKPDYQRLGITAGLSEDMLSLFKKRVYDISAMTNLKVKCNDKLIPVKQFKQYVDMYIGGKDENKRIYEEPVNGNGRWEYAVALSPTHEFIQVSFVNGIHTFKGGKHVDYILGQITRKVGEYIEKKKKIKVNANSIKEQIMLFLRCDVENPSFDSQTKDYMNTPSNKFGSVCTISEKFIENVAKMGIMESACALTEIKENNAQNKKTDGTKTKTIRGIPKLIDANWAGTAKSGECILILCEGDSAKTGVVSGLSPQDRNTIGVYPMKGKIMNVDGKTNTMISENKEITEIKKILGLENGRNYSVQDVAMKLRYSKIMFMTDQDADGSHIKGLCVNLFQSLWTSLIQIPGFISFMNTPILKATKGNQVLTFYNNGEYIEWKDNVKEQFAKWNVKYYKGLGTSSKTEFREYFQQKKIVDFQFIEGASDNAIDMAFNKKRADDRKSWLEKYDRDVYLNTSDNKVTYDDFINKELIHFSKYDCDRSIPNLMDGLKTSLRKILYSAFKRNLTKQIKVAQFAGYVSEHSGYHHGEASLNGAIIGMAQNFVGSNNINLLVPHGQMGTRRLGGEDSASERYIFTELNNPLTRVLFQEKDDAILQYLDDDGFLVEPIFYAPIVPMILINGSKGIGTGFSTDILSYHPSEIIEYLQDKLQTQQKTQQKDYTFIPFYEGFQGTIEKIENENKFLVKGKYLKIDDNTVRITELPVGTWTEKYKEFLEGLTEPSLDKNGKKKSDAFVKDIVDMSSDITVDFTVTFVQGKVEELLNQTLEHGINGLEKVLKLTTTLTTSNMHLFDAKEKLKKYATVVDILEDYFGERLSLYEKRKQYLTEALKKELVFLTNKVRYIQENRQGTIDLRNMKKEQVKELLKSKDYNVWEEDEDYKYLTKMPMDSVTEENVVKLTKDYEEKRQELHFVETTSVEQVWLSELESLKKEYLKYREERKILVTEQSNQDKKSGVTKKVVLQKKKIINKNN